MSCKCWYSHQKKTPLSYVMAPAADNQGNG